MAIWSELLTCAWPTNSSSREGLSAASALVSSGSASGVVIWSRVMSCLGQSGIPPHRASIDLHRVDRWQVTHRSVVLVVRTGRSLRLVAPQRVQIHSAVTAAVLMCYVSPSCGELLQRSPNKLRCLYWSAVSNGGPNRIIGCGDSVSQTRQRSNRFL